MKSPKIEFQKIIDTYTFENEVINNALRYQRHLNDPVRKMSFGGRTYYRIVSLELLNQANNSQILCQISAELHFKINGALIDKLGNYHTIRGAEHIHYLPEYEFLSEAFVILLLEQADETDAVGEYMAAYTEL